MRVSLSRHVRRITANRFPRPRTETAVRLTGVVHEWRLIPRLQRCLFFEVCDPRHLVTRAMSRCQTSSTACSVCTCTPEEPAAYPGGSSEFTVNPKAKTGVSGSMLASSPEEERQNFPLTKTLDLSVADLLYFGGPRLRLCWIGLCCAGPIVLFPTVGFVDTSIDPNTSRTVCPHEPATLHVRFPCSERRCWLTLGVQRWAGSNSLSHSVTRCGRC